ncbi:MAG: GNAT family N-acetyltransferase [Planctomycetes bacterium]|nr:GNAT family N-acetyltransferase [Planctomycetota bacterium]
MSDGFLVVYYPHVVVHPDYQRKGIGRELMARLLRRYNGFHQHSVLARIRRPHRLAVSSRWPCRHRFHTFHHHFDFYTRSSIRC